MLSYKDNHLITDENAAFELAIISVLGDREAQEDSFGYSLRGNEGIITVCDGMGGHEGGKMASSLAAHHIITGYEEQCPLEQPIGTLLNMTHRISEEIAGKCHEDGSPMKAGSTMVTVMIRDKDVYWVSAGDSRAYLYRGDEFVQITVDHTFRLMLDEHLAAGQITREEYEQQLYRGEALISFLGVWDLKVIDYNEVPFPLMKDDKILLMSDGLYKLVADEEIRRIIDNFSNISEALQALDMKAKKNAKALAINRDNMTVALIKIK